jgi:hypothetical protein
MRTKFLFGAAVFLAGIMLLSSGAAQAVDSLINVGSTVEVRINNNGNNVQVEGAKITSISGSAINATTTIGSYNLDWVVNTTEKTNKTRRYDGKASLDEMQVGDYISFNGTLDITASVATVKATSVKDWSIQARGDNYSGIITSITPATDTTPASFNLASGGKTIKVVVPTDAKITKGSATINFTDIKEGNKVVSTSGIFNNVTNTLTADAVRVSNAASSIVLVYPNGGQKLTQGQTITIKWNSTGLTSEDSIAFRINSTLLDLTATGSERQKQWTVPGDLAPGKYKMHISVTKDGTTFSDTSKGFDIAVAVTPVPSLKITAPKNNDSVKQGKNLTIKWTSKALSETDTINFSLLNCVNPNANCNNTPLSLTVTGDKKSASLPIISDYAPGSEYKIKIWVTKDGKTYSDVSAGYFTIKKASAGGAGVLDALKDFLGF